MTISQDLHTLPTRAMSAVLVFISGRLCPIPFEPGSHTTQILENTEEDRHPFVRMTTRDNEAIATPGTSTSELSKERTA
jgi:hypothetical protein